MKRVMFGKKGEAIETPWLDPAEAALYCGISRSTFDCHSKGVPHGGCKRTRRYHVKVLDQWINQELDVPFLPEVPEQPQQPQPGERVLHRERRTLVDPGTGKVFGRS